MLKMFFNNIPELGKTNQYVFCPVLQLTSNRHVLQPLMQFQLEISVLFKKHTRYEIKHSISKLFRYKESLNKNFLGIRTKNTSDAEYVSQTSHRQILSSFRNYQFLNPCLINFQNACFLRKFLSSLRFPKRFSICDGWKSCRSPTNFNVLSMFG